MILVEDQALRRLQGAHRPRPGCRGDPRLRPHAANRPEEEGAEPLAADIEQQGLALAEIHIERACVPSPLVAECTLEATPCLGKPWRHRATRPDLFFKADFKADVRAETITGPASQEQSYEPGENVKLDAKTCDACPLRVHCTTGRKGRGRIVRMNDDEPLQKRLRWLQGASPGRAALRERVAVEHALAHIAARKGYRAATWGPARLWSMHAPRLAAEERRPPRSSPRGHRRRVSFERIRVRSIPSLVSSQEG